MPISFRSDPQLKPLYAWEGRNGWDDNSTSFTHAGWTIHDACELYKVPQPTIKLHTTRNLPYSSPWNNLISLQRDRYLNIPIAVHEATHHIVWHRFGAKPQDHGPTFLGIYLDLLKRNGFDMYASAQLNDLKWRDVPLRNR